MLLKLNKKRLITYASAALFSVIVGLVLAFAWFFIQLRQPARQIEPEVISTSNAPDTLKVLFIGNSFTFQHMLPAVFKTIVEAGLHKSTRIWQVTFPGYRLATQWDRKAALNAIERGAPWDLVILQAQSEEALGDCKMLFDYAARFDAKIRSAKARTVLFQTWSDRNAFREEAQIYRAYELLGKQLSVPVVPVGECWFNALKKDPALELYDVDDHHPSAAGTYLTACIFYCYLFQKNPHGLPSKVLMQIEKAEAPLVDLSESEAARLQDLAWSYFKSHSTEHQ